jgi:hypothetical protein
MLEVVLLIFTKDNVPTWEIRRKAKKVAGRDDDLVVSGTADTFEAAKAAARLCHANVSAHSVVG